MCDSPDHGRGVLVRLQHLVGPGREILEDDGCDFGVRSEVGWQGSSLDGDYGRDGRVGEAGPEGGAADGARCAGEEDLHVWGGVVIGCTGSQNKILSECKRSSVRKGTILCISVKHRGLGHFGKGQPCGCYTTRQPAKRRGLILQAAGNATIVRASHLSGLSRRRQPRKRRIDGMSHISRSQARSTVVQIHHHDEGVLYGFEALRQVGDFIGGL